MNKKESLSNKNQDGSEDSIDKAGWKIMNRYRSKAKTSKDRIKNKLSYMKEIIKIFNKENLITSLIAFDILSRTFSSPFENKQYSEHKEQIALIKEELEDINFRLKKQDSWQHEFKRSVARSAPPAMVALGSGIVLKMAGPMAVSKVVPNWLQIEPSKVENELQLTKDISNQQKNEIKDLERSKKKLEDKIEVLSEEIERSEDEKIKIEETRNEMKNEFENYRKSSSKIYQINKYYENEIDNLKKRISEYQGELKLQDNQLAKEKQKADQRIQEVENRAVELLQEKDKKIKRLENKSSKLLESIEMLEKELEKMNKYDQGEIDKSERHISELMSRLDKAGNRIRTSKEEVLEQVLSGLESVNQSLGTNYKLSQIYFSPFDSGTNSVYNLLICKLIRHYHSGNEFKEV